jgi:sulfopyruvate decarboxylase subunit beta
MATLSTQDFLDHVSAKRNPDEVVVATMTAGWLWAGHSESDHDLSYIAPMGSVSAFGHGLALARPDLDVIVLDGDGSVLMQLGSLVTVGGSKPGRFLHVVLENDGYAITGGQPLPGTGTQGLVEIALAAGYPHAMRSDDPADLDTALGLIREGEGPVLLAVPVSAAFDGEKLREYTELEQSQKTLGPPGYKALREVLAANKPS